MMDITPYASVGEARTYHETFMGREDWCDQPTADQEKYLKMATRAIERLNFAGDTVDAVLQFPRGNDVSIPTDIKKACAELAWSFFDDVDPELERENLRSISQGVGASRVTYSPDVMPLYVIAGIPSQRAWNLLKPYLRDPDQIMLSRDS